MSSLFSSHVDPTCPGLLYDRSHTRLLSKIQTNPGRGLFETNTRQFGPTRHPSKKVDRQRRFI
jgi:hypothetical protein